jgi:acetolactate synthase I/II/III large subunit
MEMTGAEILVRCLQEEKVEHLFGYPGGAVLYIYDEIFKQKQVKHILVRHEQAAVHAADAYARCSEKVGVCLVTSGPGVTNAVTGIATAYMDSIPMVILSGQVPTHAIGLDAFQECDTVGITRPCVKHNFLVKDVKDLAVTIKKAFHLAKSGRPGPVLVDVPKDITVARCKFEYPEQVTMRSYNPIVKGHSGQIRKAVQMILAAERPMVYTGGGVILSNAAEQLNELVNLLGYPCTNTLMGLGAYQATDKKFLGMPGMHGTYECNMAMQHCDVLIAIGARFDDRVIGNPKHFAQNPRKIIHVDIDPSSISKRVKVDVPIVGDVKEVLIDLLAQLKEAMASGQKPAEKPLAAWWKQIDEWRGVNCLAYKKSDEFIKPQAVIEAVWRITKGDAFITSDVGQHQMWAAQYYKFDKPRRWINSGGLGTMGVGLPYAMGVKFVHPEAEAVCITGERPRFRCVFKSSPPASNIACRLRSSTSITGTSAWCGSGKKSSTAAGTPRAIWSSLPDFVKLAESYGHVGMKIEKPADVEPALKEAFAMKDRLVFMDFITDQSENVWPMVQAGKGSPTCCSARKTSRRQTP